MEPISPELFNTVSQNAHWLFGSWVTLLSVYTLGSDSLYIVIPLFFVFVIIKEYWYDYTYENKTERGSSLLDTAMYTLGVLITIIIVYFKKQRNGLK